MRASMMTCNRNTAIKRAAKICLVAAAVMGVAQFGLTPMLGTKGQMLLSAVNASLAMQGIGLMLIVSCGRLRFVAIRRRARDLSLWRVRNSWCQPGVMIESPAGS